MAEIILNNITNYWNQKVQKSMYLAAARLAELVVSNM